MRRAITFPVKTSQAKALLPSVKQYYELLHRNQEWVFEKENYNPMRCAESHQLSKLAIQAKIDPKVVYICPLAVSKVENKCITPVTNLLSTNVRHRLVAPKDVVVFMVIGTKCTTDQVPALFWWLALLDAEKPETRLTSEVVIIADNCAGDSSVSADYNAFLPGVCKDKVFNLIQSLKNQFLTITFHLTRISYNHRKNLAVKNYYAMRNLFRVMPEKKIYFKIDYDTILFPRRLKNYINTLASTTDMDNVPLYFGTTHDYLPYTLTWAQGGAGYGLNNKAMKKFVLSDVPTDHFGYGTSEDYNLWKVLSQADVTLLHCAGFFSNIKNADPNG